MKKQKFYAIKEGKGVKNKIVKSWDECKALTHGFDAIYKSFLTLEEANEYLKCNVGRWDAYNPKSSEPKQPKKESKPKSKGKSKKTVVLNEKPQKGTMTLQITFDLNLYKQFEKRCKQIQGNPDKLLKALLVESIEEWIE